MNPKTARRKIKLSRPDEVGEFQAAAGQDTAWQAELESQLSTDRSLLQAVRSLQLQAEESAKLQEPLDKIHARAGMHRFSLRDPAVLGMAFAFLLLAAFLTWQFLSSRDQVTGQSAVFGLIDLGAKSPEQQFEAVDSTLGELDDWFVMNGVEGLWVPETFRPLKVLAARVFTYEGAAVACAALPGEEMLVYIFRGRNLNVSAPNEGNWYFVSNGKESGALMEKNGVCFLAVIRGSRQDMKEQLGRILR